MSASDIKEFEFDNVKKSTKSGDAIGTFKVNGETFEVRALGDASVAYLIHKARSGDSSVVISSVLNFMEKALLPESAQRFEVLVLDPEGPFNPEEGSGLERVVEVFEHVLSIVAAGKAGGSSSASSPRRSTAGSGSKPSSRGTRASATR